jgi:hypothetical protein
MFVVCQSSKVTRVTMTNLIGNGKRDALGQVIHKTNLCVCDSVTTPIHTEGGQRVSSRTAI